MAVGPPNIIDEAEYIIDNEIMTYPTGGAVWINLNLKALNIRITKKEWDEILAPKYIKAGWSRAEWDDSKQYTSIILSI